LGGVGGGVLCKHLCSRNPVFFHIRSLRTVILPRIRFRPLTHALDEAHSKTRYTLRCNLFKQLMFTYWSLVFVFMTEIFT